MDALKHVKEGHAGDGQRIIGLTVPVAIVALTIGLGYVASTQTQILSILETHVDPGGLGHETLEERDARVREEERAVKRAEDWDGWRVDVETFILKSDTWQREVNPRASRVAEEAVADLIENGDE